MQSLVEGMEKGISLRQELWAVSKFGIQYDDGCRYAAGAGSGYIFIGTDITKQKNTEHKLRESEDFAEQHY